MISLVINALGSVNGRTRFQKLVFLVNQTGWNSFPDYRFHLHGPYSEILVKEIKDMKDNEWLVEEGHPTDYGLVFYKYQAHQDKKKILDLVIRRYADPSLVERTIGLLRQLNVYNLDELEIMASLVFLKRANPGMDDESLVRLTHELKPQFSVGKIKGCLGIFKILRPYLSSN